MWGHALQVSLRHFGQDAPHGERIAKRVSDTKHL
jgi:hypothetical protein